MMKTIGYLSGQLFTRQYAPRLGLMFLITSTNIFAATTAPFFFTLMFQESGEFLGVNLSRQNALILFATSFSLTKIFPILRELVVNPVISHITFDTIYHYDQQTLKKPHSYQVSVPIGTKQDGVITARTGTENFLSAFLHNMFPSVLEMSVAVGVINALYSWKIGLGILGLCGLSTIYNYYMGPFISRAQTAYTTARMAAGRYIASILTNFESVYYFNTLQFELSKLKKIIYDALGPDLESIQIPERISFVQSLVAQGTLFGLMVYMGNEMGAGLYSGRDLSIMVFFMMQILTPLNYLAESSSKMRAAYEELSSIINLLREDLEETPKKSLVPAKLSEGVQIVFDKVTFAYKPNEPLLERVSFVAEAGKTTAIVGSSGSGKTTLLRLLYQLYFPISGRILFDGQDISEVSLSSLRDHLAIVPQTPALFNNTLRYNISYGALSLYKNEKQIPEDLLYDAINQAGLGSFVASLPEGINKKVGENALMISGGQLQRLALARALVRKAPVIVLDECTSALDSKTEEEIQKNMRVAFKNKTVITIAHRLSTIKDADKIIVLEKGRVSEEGNFTELMARNGVFTELYRKQINQLSDKGVKELTPPSATQPFPTSDDSKVDKSKSSAKHSSHSIWIAEKKEIIGLQEQLLPKELQSSDSHDIG